MKKTIIFLVVLFAISASTFSQVKYTSSGLFGIGTISPSYLLHLDSSDPSLFMQSSINHDNIIRLVEGATWLGAYISYDGGDNNFIIGTHPSSNSLTTSDVQIFTMRRDNGELDFYPQSSTAYSSTLTTHAKADEVKCYSVYRDGVDKFHVRGDGDVYIRQVFHASDLSLKENIKEINSSIELLKQLRPVEYNFKVEEGEGYNNEARLEFGLIAQEVEEILPNIVSTKDDGIKTIAYTELIPLLINAINEQQAEIDELKSQINPEKQANEIQTSGVSSALIENSNLFQNAPNPFNENTIVKYIIPATASTAMINLYDLQGKQVMSHSIYQNGIGEIIIPATELDPGIYIYNLIVDDYEVDSKKMILTD